MIFILQRKIKKIGQADDSGFIEFIERTVNSRNSEKNFLSKSDDENERD